MRNSAERDALLSKFQRVIRPNPAIDRSLVSFQGNRKKPFFGWLKYKEGFSADLVRYLIDAFGRHPGVLLDPFAGVGTAPFVGKALGWRAIGIELMPVGFFAMETRLAAECVNHKTLQRNIERASHVDWVDYYDEAYAFKHIPITRSAFPRQAERELCGYRAFCDRHLRCPHTKKVFQLAGLAILESISYTRKDGQYLRWDSRARKARSKSDFDKGRIPRFGEALRHKLANIRDDLVRGSKPDETLFGPDPPNLGRPGGLDIRRGSCFTILPQIDDESVDLVITSPPYCNRYDYTRTYALELVYLGLGAEDVKRLRQALLSSTVENRAKVAELNTAYLSQNHRARFERATGTFGRQRALHEVLGILETQTRNGRLNNTNIPRMVRNYFFEMSFVILELSRILRRGGHVVMVNDNVRYGGEEVPVDLILSAMAREFGLRVKHIWTLSRGKGNSSQQMGAHGRSELRKCVYVWSKI